MEGIGEGIESMFKFLIGMILLLASVLTLVLLDASLRDILLPVATIAGWETGKAVYRWVFGL